MKIKMILPALIGAAMTGLVMLLLFALYATSARAEKTVRNDPYYASAYPACTLCWYEWMAEQANQKQKP